MKQEKAYKLLASQEKISKNEAKALIDAGLVSCGGQKISIARSLLNENVTFKIAKFSPLSVIFADENIMAVNKPPFFTSENVAKSLNFPLLNRLDKETSGVLLLYKNSEFQKKAIIQFAQNRVKKSYIAIVSGIIAENFSISLPILTIKTKRGAFSKIDLKSGKNAITHIFPLMISGKKSLVKIDIETGRTHQIRCHLANANYGIIGDEKYAKITANRLFLHSYEMQILGYKFRASLDKSFQNFGFELPKELM